MVSTLMLKRSASGQVETVVFISSMAQSCRSKMALGCLNLGLSGAHCGGKPSRPHPRQRAQTSNDCIPIDMARPRLMRGEQFDDAPGRVVTEETPMVLGRLVGDGGAARKKRLFIGCECRLGVAGMITQRQAQFSAI
jgi:hypothetical protein